MLNKTICFIGPGAMAEAMLAGLLRQNLATPEHLLVSGPRPERGLQLKAKYGVQPFTENSTAARDADVVVLSVKPQRLSGVMEKEDPTNEEFIVPGKLKELYQKKDFGRYGSGDDLVTCFLTNNDITGGNSGSPVINGNGELIGLAFDGNWEAMSGNIAYEPNLQRTICVDTRYVLFVIDKYAGEQNIIDELTIAPIKFKVPRAEFEASLGKK